MQIHELTRKQITEVDIVGPDGVLSKIGTAAKALVQPGGVKSALKTITPGFGQGALNTKDLATGDFAQRMQAVKNSAAIKQVAASLQQQWNQVSKTLPAATATSPELNKSRNELALLKVAVVCLVHVDPPLVVFQIPPS